MVLKKNIITVVMLSLLKSILLLQAGDFENYKHYLKIADRFYQKSNYQDAYCLYNVFLKDKRIMGIDKKNLEISYPFGCLGPKHGLFLYKMDKSDYYQARVNCGDASAALGKWKEAAKHWRWRVSAGKFGRVPLEKSWDYSDPKGKKIVVYSERDSGAFGDSFIMLKLLKMLKSDGAHITFVPQKPLQKVCELQTESIDQVVLRGQDIPKHDAATYLWSILNYAYQDQNYYKLSDNNHWLQAPSLRPELQEHLEKYKNKLLVGFWYRGSGATTLAADNRSLSRDPGANVIIKKLGLLDNVALVCLEGMGHYPIKKTKYLAQIDNNEQLDDLDLIDDTVDDSNLVLMPSDFDKTSGAFVDTCSVMQYIKQQSGYLVGCDTSLLMAAAGIKTEKESGGKYQTLALTNEKRDFRWGLAQEKVPEYTARKPKEWSLASDVLVFQNLEQNDWKDSVKQVKDYIIQTRDPILGIVEKL